MKLLIISDLHGAVDEVEQALAYFDKLGCEGLLLLGDYLNHGPRNAVPESYNPRRVAALLNAYKDRCVAVRGNCECEADGMLLDFPCDAPYQQLLLSSRGGVRRVFLTHGHLHNFQGDPQALGRLGLKSGDIVLSGHTHIAGVFELANGIINFNPGSTTFPRAGSHRGFGLLDEHVLRSYDLDGCLQAELELGA